MVWLNEKWHRAGGHITGIIPLTHFQDTIIDSLLTEFPTQTRATISDRIKEAWKMVVRGHDVIKDVNSAMDFEAFCQAIDILHKAKQ